MSPRKADEAVRKALGDKGLPEVLRHMHTSDDLSVHKSENTLEMVLAVVENTASLF